MSVICFSSVTKCVRLKSKELQFLKIDDFFENPTYSGEGFDHPNLLSEILIVISLFQCAL